MVKLHARVDKKEGTMPEEPGLCGVVVGRVPLPPLDARARFHWDGVGTVAPFVGCRTGSDSYHPAVPVARSFRPDSGQAGCQAASEHDARASLNASAVGLSRSSPRHAIDWKREARSLTCHLDSALVVALTHGMAPGAAGHLLWVHRGGYVQSIILYAHPVLLLHAANASRHADHVEIVPHFHSGDPLFHHITLVLKTEIYAHNVTGRLYAESLTNALAVHFLKRCAPCLQPVRPFPSGLAPYKLRRATTYIRQHLDHDLYLIELAAVAQTSPAHFARLFKHSTGQTPHQYVLSCRVGRAKQLLTDTVLPLSDIGHQVGCTDQSHFTALFRKHVGMTPKAYRDATQRY
jgi:AraC family transcriptional regulator